MKVFISILFITFLTGLPLVEDVHGSFKPKPKGKNSCTVYRGKYTVSDLIEYRYGIVAGQNIATIKSKGSDQNVISRLMAGVAVQVIWPKGFALQPELLYSQKGCIYTGTGNTEYDIDYLEIPVKAMYRLYLADVKPFVFVAPYTAYALKLTPNGDVDVADIDLPQLNRFDAGIGVGAGFDIWKVQLSFRYSWGFAQVLNAAYPVHNNVFTLSLGLLF